ncbi:hypothetical protein ACIBQ6_22310 [Nonomuraea sp. NPDC049655]|uniref:hypothetical protein n=1 Tax=Nonomuraea sp. NPDC049655 TaxID=3364355 RepID=UPI00378A96F4
MSALLPWLVLTLLVCGVREVSPDALTPAQIRARLQVCGWRRIVCRSLQIAIVVALLLLAACARFCWHALHGIAAVLVILAAGIGSLDPPQTLPSSEDI